MQVSGDEDQCQTAKPAEIFSDHRIFIHSLCHGPADERNDQIRRHGGKRHQNPKDQQLKCYIVVGDRTAARLNELGQEQYEEKHGFGIEKLNQYALPDD